MRRSDWWPELVGLAETQAGLFTAAQAQTVGARRPQLVDLVNRGVIERLLHGVYQLSGSPVDQWTSMRAAWLSLAPARTAADRLASDPEGVISHRSAALLLGLGDLDADRIEITIDTRRRTRNTDVLIHRGHLDHGDWIAYEGLPVTTPARTVATLALTGLDAGHLATMARDALLRHDVPTQQLADALDPAARRYDYRSGDELLDDLLHQVGVPSSAVDVVAAAATTHLVSAIARSTQVSELTRQISEQLTATPAWQQMLRNLSATSQATETIRQALEPIQHQLAAAAPRITVPPITVPNFTQAQQVAQAALAAAITPHLREQLDRAAATARDTTSQGTE